MKIFFLRYLLKYKPLIFGIFSKSGSFLYQIVAGWLITKYFSVQELAEYVILSTAFLTLQSFDFGLLGSYLYSYKYTITIDSIIKRCSKLFGFYAILILVLYFYIHEKSIYFENRGLINLFLFIVPCFYLNIFLVCLRNYQIGIGQISQIYAIDVFSYGLSIPLIILLGSLLGFELFLVAVFYVPIIIQSIKFLKLDYFFAKKNLDLKRSVKSGLLLLQIFGLLYNYLPIYAFSFSNNAIDTSLYSIMFRVYSIPLLVLSLQLASYQYLFNKVYQKKPRKFSGVYVRLIFNSLIFAAATIVLVGFLCKPIIEMLTNQKIHATIYSIFAFSLFIFAGAFSAVNSIVLNTANFFRVQIIFHSVASILIMLFFFFLYKAVNVWSMISVYFLIQLIAQSLLFIYIWRTNKFNLMKVNF
jgi:hypothetical protein